MMKYGIRDIKKKYLFYGENSFTLIRDNDGYFGTNDINEAYKCLEDLYPRYPGIEIFEKEANQ